GCTYTVNRLGASVEYFSGSRFFRMLSTTASMRSRAGRRAACGAGFSWVGAMAFFQGLSRDSVARRREPSDLAPIEPRNDRRRYDYACQVSIAPRRGSHPRLLCARRRSTVLVDFQGYCRSPATVRVRFADFTLDSATRQLLHRGRGEIRLSPKAFDLLAAL